MSGPTTTKEFISHTSRETESSHKATPQRNSSSTESRRVAAPKKSSSMAKASVTSAAAVKSTSVTKSRRVAAPKKSSSMAKASVTSAGVVKRTSVTTKRIVDISTLQPNSFHERLAKLKEAQDAVDAKEAQEAAEKKEKEREERQKRADERKQKIAKSRCHPDPRYSRSYMNDPLSESDDAAIEPQRNSAAKKRPAKDEKPKKTKGKKKAKKSDASSTSPIPTSSNEIKPTTTKQLELPNAESGLDSTEAASASHDTSSSPVPASAPGDAQDPPTALRTWIRDNFSKLTFSQFESFVELLNYYGNSNLSSDDEFDLNDIPDARLQIFVTWMKGRFLINETAGDKAGDPEDTQAGATQSEAEQTEQSEPQLEKSKPSTPANGAKKHGKKFFDDDDDDEQGTSGDSDVPRRKKARNSEPQSSPREKSAHAASRKGSLDESAMTSSIQNSVTVCSATVNGGPVPVVTGGMIPFSADGHAAQKYHDLLDQRFSEELAEFMKGESGKKAPKRNASEAQLDEPVAKKPKHSDNEKALLKEAEQATEESMAEAKTFKQEEIMEKPEVASSAGNESMPITDTASSTLHSHETATGVDASATETEPTAKKEADSKKDDENTSSSSNSNSDDEKKVVEETSKTGSANANTSPSTNEHQDATQGDNKTSQASDESSSNQTAATTTTKQQEAPHSGEAEPTSETQDGQKGPEAEATDAPASTMTSGPATETNTQKTTARKTNKYAKNGDKKLSTKTKSEPEPQSNKKPSASTPKPQSGPPANRFMPSATAYNKRQASRNNPSQASTKGQKPAVKKPLADKSNTYRQPTKLGQKNISAVSKNKQPEAAKKPSAPVKSAASNKRKLDEDDAVESTTKPAKQQRKEPSKKRSRKEIEEDDDDDDAGSIEKPAKKQQRTNSSSVSTSRQPDPHASAPLNPGRASRRQAAAEKKAAEAARSQVPRKHNEALWVDFDDDVQPQPQNQAQTQPSGPVTKDEKTDKQTSEDDAKHGVKDNTSGDAGNTEDAPAGNDGAPQPQQKKKKKAFVAHRKGEEPEDPDELKDLRERKKKQQQEKNRVKSEGAQKAKEVQKFVAKGSRR